MNPFFFRRPQPPPAPSQQEMVRHQVEHQETASFQYGRKLPAPTPTRDERYLHFLLNPCIPKQRPYLKKNWVLATEAAKHLQLTNITDPMMLARLQRFVTDLFRVATWDAPEYLEERNLKMHSMLLLNKSIAYGRVPRERDALNENRETRILRDDRTPPPRESGNLMSGMFAR